MFKNVQKSLLKMSYLFKKTVTKNEATFWRKKEEESLLDSRNWWVSLLGDYDCRVNLFDCNNCRLIFFEVITVNQGYWMISTVM